MIKKNEKKLNKIAKVAIIVYSNLIFLKALLPAVRDILTVLTKNYQVVQGSIIEDAKVTNKAFPAGITVKDEQTGKTVRVRAYFTGTIKRKFG